MIIMINRIQYNAKCYIDALDKEKYTINLYHSVNSIDDKDKRL